MSLVLVLFGVWSLIFKCITSNNSCPFEARKVESVGYEGEQESILLFQLGDVYLPVYLRYGTKRLERRRNVKADAEEEEE